MAGDSNVDMLKRHFGADGYPELTSRELMELRKADRDGYDAIVAGLNDGSLTY